MSSARLGIRVASITTFVVAASFIPRPVRAFQDFSSPRDAQVNTAGARSIRIEAAAGFLRVQGRSGITQVTVKGTARSNRRNLLDDIKLIAERRGDEVFIKADMPDDDRFWGSGRNYDQAQLDLIIEVPSSISLDVADGSGDAEFLNAGALELSDGSGEILIRDAHGDVRVTDGSGNVSFLGVQGSVRVNDGSGNIRGRDVTGDFVVGDDGSGDIDVSGVGGLMRVENDGSGNIDVDRIAGDFVVEHDGSGVIRYDTVKGSVRIPDRKRRS